MLDLTQRILALEAWGKALATATGREATASQAAAQNPWFTVDLVQEAIQAICDDYLNRPALEIWLSGWEDKSESRDVGIVMAGNIPLVGFHDLLSVLATGNRALVKTSSKDEVLIKWVIGWLEEVEPLLGKQIELRERLTEMDAVIATGSRNTSRYFDRYFAKWPHIIRKNRHGVAVLRGEESEKDLLALGQDVFKYFGLGCRSVSKLYLPKGYDPARVMAAFEAYSHVAEHTRYRHNFEYHRSVFLLNQIKHYSSDFLCMLEKAEIASSIATLHYSFYESEAELKQELLGQQELIQCVVGKGINEVPFGDAQRPALTDYADGIDTLEFLAGI